MSLISQALFAILITFVAGTIAFALWKLSKNMFCNWNSNQVYILLRCVCLLYVIPVGYLLIQLTVKDGYLQSDTLWQMNFTVTGIMEILFGIIGIFWSIFTIQSLSEQIRQFLKWRQIYLGNIPEEDDVAIEEFLRIKRKLKIYRKIGLYRNDMLGSPMLAGVFRCNVVLPYRKYSRDQLRVIFYHELMHYKSYDLLYKLCAVYVDVVQHLSTFSDALMVFLNEWSEYHCDRRAIEAMRDEVTAGRYFEMIMEVMRSKPVSEEEDYIFSMLYESQLSLERRIDYVKKYTKATGAVKGITAMLTLMFVTVSVTTAYAAGSKLADVNDYLYKETEQVVEEDRSAAEEVFLSADEDHTYSEVVYEEKMVQEAAPLLNANEISSFNWTVTPGVRHVSDKISLKAGQSVTISCTATPANNTYWIGIMRSNGDVRYVSGSGSFGHTFTIDINDSYRVLVQNQGNSTITAAGSYYYY